MKKIWILSLMAISASLQAQLKLETTAPSLEFNKQLVASRTAYASGKLDDSRFAMQNMLQQLDMIVGVEIMKNLPAKMLTKNANNAKDQVNAASGFAGVVVHREYGLDSNIAEVEIVTNSPMLVSVNALLSLPMMGLGSNGDSKVIKVSGFKALQQKQSGDNGRVDYEIQIPMTSTLITFKAPGLSESQVQTLAATLPLDKINKLTQ